MCLKLEYFSFLFDYCKCKPDKKFVIKDNFLLINLNRWLAPEFMLLVYLSTYVDVDNREIIILNE